MVEARKELTTTNLLASSVNAKPMMVEGMDSVLEEVPRINKVLGDSKSPRMPKKSLLSSIFSTRTSPCTPQVTSIVDGLKIIYEEKLKPLEIAYCYNKFEYPLLTNDDFDGKPTVVILGENSTEKTAFMKHMSTLVEEITFVDTPETRYSFTCDLILLMFDTCDVDNIISDELRCVISSLSRSQKRKVRVILKNADQVEPVQLMKFYGAVMHTLGEELKSPNEPRVYIGSFSDRPMNEELVGPVHTDFEKEQADFLAELLRIAKTPVDRWICLFHARASGAKTHTYIISELKKEMMAATLTTLKAQKKVINNLEDVFAKVRGKLGLSAGDLPDMEHFRQVLGSCNMIKFKKLKPKMIQAVDDILQHDLGDLLRKFKY